MNLRELHNASHNIKETLALIFHYVPFYDMIWMIGRVDMFSRMGRKRNRNNALNESK